MDELDVGEIPDGWFILWNPPTFESILWTTSVAQQYQFPNEWFEMLEWAQKEAMSNA